MRCLWQTLLTGRFLLVANKLVRRGTPHIYSLRPFKFTAESYAGLHWANQAYLEVDSSRIRGLSARFGLDFGIRVSRPLVLPLVNGDIGDNFCIERKLEGLPCCGFAEHRPVIKRELASSPFKGARLCRTFVISIPHKASEVYSINSSSAVAYCIVMEVYS